MTDWSIYYYTHPLWLRLEFIRLLSENYAREVSRKPIKRLDAHRPQALKTKRMKPFNWH